MKRVGLGDLAYWAFRPVVYGIDGIWGTDMRHCTVCADRRKRWNAIGTIPLWPSILLVTIGVALILWGKC